MNSKRANIFRFQYPERPTLFFAICYLAVSLVCLIGLISPEAIVCSSEIRNSEGLIEHGTGLIQGATARPCTILFMIFFYFSSKFFCFLRDKDTCSSSYRLTQPLLLTFTMLYLCILSVSCFFT